MYLCYLHNKTPTQSPINHNDKRCTVLLNGGICMSNCIHETGLCIALTHFRYQLRLNQVLDHFVPMCKSV